MDLLHVVMQMACQSTVTATSKAIITRGKKTAGGKCQTRCIKLLNGVIECATWVHVSDDKIWV